MKKNLREDKINNILNLASEILTLKPTATLQEIADYSRIGIATLHRYFPSRNILLDQLAFNAINLVNLSLKDLTYDYDDLESTLLKIFNVLIPLGNKISFLISAATVDENVEIICEEKKIKDKFIHLLDKFKDKKVLSPDFQSRWMVNVMYQLLFVAWQEIQAGNLAPNDAPRLLVQTVLHGFSIKNN